MKNIIVTITDRKNHFYYDIEVPTDLPGQKLTGDVMEMLDAQEEELHFNALYHCLYLNRLRRPLADDETLAAVGIRNGDNLTVISRL